MDEAQEYGKKLISLQNQKEREIKKIYYDAIVDLSLLASTLPYKQTIFTLANYPLLKRRVDYVLAGMAKKLEVTIVNGVDQAWQLSDEKNRVFLDRKLKNFKVSGKARKIYYDTNHQAKTAFKTRRTKGLGLSKRVWKTLEPFKNQVELGLAEGISTGESAVRMASRMKKELNDPDKLFRRVRAKSDDPKSQLKLSKAALNYQPGQGVYRSSYKNALRLTRTETNMAYRTADHDRWLTQPFVVGIEIRLSEAHPRTDICDPLAGKYPKDFKWVGWHPQCICYQVPILITSEEMSLYEDQILGIGKWDGKSVNQVNDAPPAFYKYVEERAADLGRLKSVPYWVKDNAKYVTALAG
ncbi:hypothetical protein EGT74_24495 [Chitinophaga lutea]|uniref:Phage head morphogenesis domain-containing protein n=1 Tax=Chitinophaga lutea TaxID=2488634 RepID=A0A3N4PBD3_9BACT|nr:hypothetical protein [Chitinophaga lutea]RPE05546.1 hypothetical protein EGT74_24495 [Chitinophaga lutea]